MPPFFNGVAIAPECRAIIQNVKTYTNLESKAFIRQIRRK
uniref:Uncharacterized protein n=1 Tax=Myoviridae sp. ct6aW5 TaxID=2825036 RepID=A0A8S5PHG7_9CAUD|nr:MAG TPA: hypothetical protein [Myoviridae sp. ct6aW5]DAK91692.1 MAG TPA: hypothetical protein [Caudoviricetes sp.]